MQKAWLGVLIIFGFIAYAMAVCIPVSDEFDSGLNVQPGIPIAKRTYTIAPSGAEWIFSLIDIDSQGEAGQLRVYGSKVAGCGGSGEPIFTLDYTATFPYAVFSFGPALVFEWQDLIGQTNVSVLYGAQQFNESTYWGEPSIPRLKARDAEERDSTKGGPCGGGETYFGPYPYTFNTSDLVYTEGGDGTGVSTTIRGAFCGYQFKVDNSSGPGDFSLRIQATGVQLAQGDKLQGFDGEKWSDNGALFYVDADSDSFDIDATASANADVFVLYTTFTDVVTPVNGFTMTVSLTTPPTPTPAPNGDGGDGDGGNSAASTLSSFLF